MARLVAFNILFFLLPFAIYAAWLFATKGSASRAGDWQLKVIAWLAIAGAALMVVAIVVFISFDAAEPGRTYVPARLENGVIIPGHFK